MRNIYQTRTIRLVSPIQQETAINALKNAPLDQEHPIEVVIREERKTRSIDANARMWAGPLRDISEQAWVHGKQYTPLVWHEYFKEQFLPEYFDEQLTKEGYQKYDETPNGKKILIGSTSKLTKKGFSEYLMQIEAYGAELGVMFHEIDHTT
jgi:hypothetical protein